jgi:hypothetical protein
MKNEQRASLLIVDTRLTQQNGFHSMHETSGSASLWSDGRRTYALLFNGSDREMRAYPCDQANDGAAWLPAAEDYASSNIAKMGIDT